VNLYPFRETIAKAGVTLDEAIENIDIGGPAMVRSSAKNYPGVAVVTDPQDYAALLAEMASSDGQLSLGTRFRLARKAFVHTARYDAAIANWLTSLDADNQPQPFPEQLQLAFDRVETLRYGENPHQQAAFYRDPTPLAGSIANYRQLQGKELSYNNIADADAAWECVKTFETPACVIIKHANPCGVAVAESLLSAYEKAFQTDSTSAFGGIIAFNGTVDAEVVAAMNARKHFVEVLLAPAFSDTARNMLAAKQNLRVLELPLARIYHAFEMKRVGGGLLLQTPDRFNVQASDLKVVSRIAPTEAQVEDLLFAYRVAKFVKSNAIVFCGRGMTLGVGAGQMSRVDSTRIAASKAQNAGLDLTGSCVASDAFFPFRDGLDVLAAAGAKAVIQPGGSMRDEEVIAAANEHGLAMVFTGTRHFRH
jgi:phosphoribosylaminoimidazolecarboxamide formyltransferase/IMP cyclohydrolase